MIFDLSNTIRYSGSSLIVFLISSCRLFTYPSLLQVVGLGTLLSSLANDHPRIAQKITKLLIPSYFPSKLSPKEACARCIALIKRSPAAGVRFCEFALSEGSSPKSIVELVKFSITLALSRTGLDSDQIDGLIMASANLIKSLSEEHSNLSTLREFLNAKLRLVLKTVVSEGARAALLSIAPVVLPDNLSVLHEECMDIVVNAARISKQEECQESALAAHKLIVLSGCSDELFEALTNILQSKASEFAEIYGLEPPPCPVTSSRRKKGKSAKKTQARDYVLGKGSSKSKLSNEELAVAAGAAWQINEIVKAEELRDSFLQSSYSEIAFSSLKVISQVFVEQCLHLDSLDLAPVLAYLSLATYNALPDVDPGSCSEVRSTSKFPPHLDLTVCTKILIACILIS